MQHVLSLALTFGSLATLGCSSSASAPAAASTAPTFTNVWFCTAKSSSGTCAANNTSFPTGLANIYASAVIGQVKAPTVTYAMYALQNGSKVKFAGGDLPTAATRIATVTVETVVSQPNGISAGNYEWDITVNDQGQNVTTTAPFTVK